MSHTHLGPGSATTTGADIDEATATDRGSPLPDRVVVEKIETQPMTAEEHRQAVKAWAALFCQWLSDHESSGNQPE